MNIRQKLALTIITESIIFLAGIIMIFTSGISLRRWNEVQIVTSDMYGTITDLTILAFDYSTNYHDRAREQWETGYALLEEHNAYLETNVLTRDDILQSGIWLKINRLKTQFDQIVSIRDTVERSDQSSALIEDRRRIIITLFLNGSQDVSASAHSFLNEVRARATAARTTTVNILLGLLLAILFISTFLGIIIQAEVLRSIVGLSGSVKALMSGGNFESQETGRTDEIGYLARSIEQIFSQVSREIHVRKKKEAQLTSTMRKLEISNRDLEQFAYIASHDLQEPLRKVANFTQLFVSKFVAEDDEKARKYLFFIEDGITRMQQLIHDLLSFSRVARQENTLTACNSQKLLEMAMTQIEIPEDANIRSGKLPEVLAPQQLLIQLFQNLVGNAVKYRNPDKPLELNISCTTRNNTHTFTFADNGIGIAQDQATNIFKAFYRLHSQQEYSGTGIGLAICMRIVNRYGGDLWVESEPGKGSTFKFTWPIKPNQEKLQEVSAKESVAT